MARKWISLLSYLHIAHTHPHSCNPTSSMLDFNRLQTTVFQYTHNAIKWRWGDTIKLSQGGTSKFPCFIETSAKKTEASNYDGKYIKSETKFHATNTRTWKPLGDQWKALPHSIEMFQTPNHTCIRAIDYIYIDVCWPDSSCLEN